MNALVQDSLQSGASLTLITLAVIGFLTVDIALPIPSSFVLSTTGYLLGMAAGTAVCFLGMSVSSAIGYWLGHYAGAPLARRLIGARGLRDFNALVHRYGDATLVAFRAVPVLAEATLLVAGLSPMKFARFMTIVSIGNLIVSALYAWIGAVSADRSSFLFASVASIVIPTIIVILTRQVAARHPGAGEAERPTSRRRTESMPNPEPHPITPDQLPAVALAVLDRHRFPMLATLDGTQPRVRPVTATWHEGFTVYFASLERFHKTGELRAAPQGELCYLDSDDDQVRITGLCERVSDRATQEEAFRRDSLLRQYLGGPDNPEFTLWRVRPTRVRFMREWALEYHEVPLPHGEATGLPGAGSTA